MANRRKPALMAFSAAVFSVAASLAGAATQDLFHMDFDDKDHPGVQPAPLPAGQVVGDAIASEEYPGALHMGKNGFVMLPAFKGPKGPFSVEARFRLNEYAMQSSRYITDIFNTSTWDTVVTQGFVLRVGGNYPYSSLPEKDYASAADYLADREWSNSAQRADAYVCIGEFATAIKGDVRAWKQVETERCIARNTWTHMVGVWDGADMHIYLNGLYATDTNRVVNKAAVPNIDSLATAFVGSRTYGTFDPRHLNGDIDFVRVVDSAMGAAEIRARYRQTRDDANDTLCHGAIIPAYPNPGQAITLETLFNAKIIIDGACTVPGFVPTLLPTDSIEVEIASDFQFTNVLIRMVVKDPSFKIDASLLTLTAFTGGAYWRVRIKHAQQAPALSKSNAVPGTEWSLGRPVMVDLKRAPTSMGPRINISGRILALPGARLSVPAQGSLVPGLWSLDGARSPVSWVREGNRWIANMPQGRESRVLLLGWE